MKTILIIEAHLDDAIFGCFGIIKKYMDAGYRIMIYTLCSGRRHDTDNRFKEVKEFYASLNIVMNHPLYFDTELTNNDIHAIVTDLSSLMSTYKPEIVLFPESDLHPDHGIANNIGKIISRPIPKAWGNWGGEIIKAGTYSILSSNHWNFKCQPSSGWEAYELNESDISFIMDGLKVVNQETKPNPDLRSIDATLNTLKVNGHMYGFKYAQILNINYNRSPLN
jgi:LmbE family N-acetylglucosaminyl deacetylase